MSEIWKPVPSLDGKVEASSGGRLRKVLGGGYFYYKLKRNGRYTRISVSLGNSRKTYSLHRLVCEAFHGPAPEGKPDARHLDDDPDNNSPDNLAWGSHSENMQDRIRNGLNPWSNKTHCPRGHEYTDSNTYRNPQTGHRSCRECRNQFVRNSEARAVESGNLGAHGTLTRYGRGCRCDDCSNRRREYKRAWVARKRSLELDEKAE